MLGFVAPLLVSAAALAPSASVTCPESPASCDGAALGIEISAAIVDDGPRDYATPTEVDCPVPADAAIAAGECEPIAFDGWYRVSRLPDSERPSGGFAPAPRRARAAKGASCGGDLPDAAHWSAPDVQPIALYAVPGLTTTEGRKLVVIQARELPVRAIAPPDRPPRA
jgi:hypothetical protein